MREQRRGRPRFLFMIVALINADSAARLVEEAYNIAWNYLSLSGQIDSPSRAICCCRKRSRG